MQHDGYISRTILCLFFTFTSLLTYSQTLPSPSEQTITIFIRDDVYEDYLNFVNNRDILAIKNFTGKTVRRDVVDMIIAQQALKLGGFTHQFKYVPGKLNFRNTQLIEQGRLLISFDSYWLNDAKALQENVYISAPLIRNGEYVAGIYTAPTNTKVLSIKQLSDLQQFTAVSTPKWRTDWQTLQSLSLKKLVQEDEWLSQARMVNLGWIDFMLMAFHSSADKSFTMEKIHLVPVPNIGVVLNDSRHFVISRKHPLGKAAITAINKGLKKLRENENISNAYTQAGFFVDKTKVHIINR
ncbi:hypothetical protein [Thalassotalea sp. G2M2-11]|uniref:hypothetical protein n=1 Tax=Thalassotalea sp. G2M2-11 TaxID=2787627 RepID=UPI001F493997|nr:hypothetical protein [Thalassotalea sp. G2M2-11]